jgi:mevalonate kinase
MMKWLIPAKTYLLGEYAALAGQGAILLNTKPCFEVDLTDKPGLQGIHKDSPAGRWWREQGDSSGGLCFTDPYHGLGGMGASTAQFLGVYRAIEHIKQAGNFSREHLLSSYWASAWSGRGIRPSGYDLLAQSSSADIVYINAKQAQFKPLTWVFHDLSFIIVHTGNKIATHQHLQNTVMPAAVNDLHQITQRALHAFENVNACDLIQSIQAYHQALDSMNLVHDHTLKLISSLKQNPDILAMKGCGALGADVLLIVTTKQASNDVQTQLRAVDLKVLAKES